MRADMKCKHLLLVAVFLLANCSLIYAQTPITQTPKVLHNGDILRMHRAGMKPGEIIAKIVTSECNFDTFPQVQRELKTKGLPDTVVMAMVMVPYGPPSLTLVVTREADAAPPTVRTQIPKGTIIQLEPAAPISSADAREGDKIKFLVSRRVLVNGVTVIERGAEARARIVKSKQAASWGRGGLLGWVVEDVVSVDGSRVPIKLTDRLHGKNRSKAVVAAAIATGAVVLPYSSPVGLVWALKKGDHAVLEESRKSIAIVSAPTEVAGLLPKSRRIINHPVEGLKGQPEKATGLTPMNSSFKATPLKQ